MSLVYDTLCLMFAHKTRVRTVGFGGAARTVRAAWPGAGARALPSGARPAAILLACISHAPSRSRTVRA